MPGPTVQRRFPFGPVADRVDNVLAFCRTANISPGAYHRYARTGGIPMQSADRIAVYGFGAHPCELWPDWFEEAS